MSEVEFFDDGTAVINETFRLDGEWPIGDEISPTEGLVKTEADWILTTDGSLVIAALEGVHTTVLKPMKKSGGWFLALDDTSNKSKWIPRRYSRRCKRCCKAGPRQCKRVPYSG